MGIARSPDLQTLDLLSNKLVRWLRDDALPLWERHGVDRALGGYFENLDFDPQTRHIHASGKIRRGRVVARQIFAFGAGQSLGWQSARADPVGHGCDFLFSRLHAGDGRFHTSVDALTHRPEGNFSLYETAFYLFVLARLPAPLKRQYPVHETAVACLRRLRCGWGRANGGFEETNPPTLPLKSNPHMHLLEAALAWVGAAEPPERNIWVELAQELVELCRARFVDAATGAIAETYDALWQPMAGRTGLTIEPGHQFEWAWLLMRWAASPHCLAAHRQSCRHAARRLVQIGELRGVDPLRGVAINELCGDLTVKDPAAKLWPQTERLKAWCAMFEDAQTIGDAEAACQKISEAAAALARYFYGEPAGMWHELQRPDGSFTQEPCKASSLYHIVCAIEVLGRTSSAAGAAVSGREARPQPSFG